jgi:uncharacterized membrane protein YphA (DoxX/SURF4 family)
MAAEYVATRARWIVGAVLLVAGLTKVRSPKAVARTVADYGILPGSFARPVATLLSPLEVLLGLALVLGVGVQVAGAISAALFAAFGAAVARNLARGNYIRCGCFGASGRERIGPATLSRNVVLLALSMVAALLANPYLSLAALGNPDAQSYPPTENAVPLALLTAAVVAAYAFMKTMLQLHEVNKQ